MEKFEPTQSHLTSLSTNKLFMKNVSIIPCILTLSCETSKLLFDPFPKVLMWNQ